MEEALLRIGSIVMLDAVEEGNWLSSCDDESSLKNENVEVETHKQNHRG
jgi:hypothetical protein